MDRPIPAVASRRLWPIAMGGLVLASAAVVMASLRGPMPSVERDRIVIDSVRRGPFVHEIAAPGTLVAEQMRLIAAPAAGRVESIHVKAGDSVRRGDAIVTLTNREAMKELLEVEQQLAVAEADLAGIGATLQAQRLDEQKALRRTEFEQRDAERRAEAATRLAQEGLTPELEAIRARESAVEIAGRVASERARRVAIERSAAAQLDAQRNRIARLRALHAFQKSIVEGLVVRTPADGVVRDAPVQEGEWVTEGHRLARLVEPGRLKAVLQVPEATALDVRAGQDVALNARGTTLRGVVDRVAATVEQGTVAVEVRLSGDLPDSLRPDLGIDGRIVLSRAGEVLTIARPAHAIPNGTAALYRIDESGRTAHRTAVRFGAASVDRIVIAAGAAAGDRLLISGTNAVEEPVIRIE